MKTTDEVKQIIKDSTILITGGTGSFGHSVVSKLLLFSPKRVIIYSRDEKKQHDMRNFFNTPLLQFVIGDVRDKEQITKYMEGVDYVFHAAALKQVPTCEFFPIEAVKTNIIGTYNVMEAASLHQVKRAVFLSTDKAVYPINAMGMSKALMEKTVVAESKRFPAGKQTIYCCIRYGNVLYTRGSVLPHFVNLMKEKKELTVTNLRMTRFLLPLEEAVDLVLYALMKGKNGYTYVRKSPACTMEILATAFCRLFSYEHGFKEVGMRAGEKIHETLVTKEEMLRVQETPKYYCIPPESQGLDYNMYLYQGQYTSTKSRHPFTSENTKQLNTDETIQMLQKIQQINRSLL